MFEYVTDRVAQKATRTAQTAAIGFGAMLCLIVGGAFLAVAAWLFLLTITTPLVACLIMGSLFFGMGLVSGPVQSGVRNAKPPYAPRRCNRRKPPAASAESPRSSRLSSTV